MEKRILNIRPIFVVWLSMMLGILTFYCVINVVHLSKSLFWLILLIVVELAIIILFVLSTLPQIKFARLKKYKWLLLAAIISMLVPLAVFGIKYNNYLHYRYLSGEVNIVGRVENCNVANENATIVLGECMVGKDNYEVKNITLVVTNQINAFDVGCVLSVNATIRTTKLFTDQNNLGIYNNDNVYSAYCSSDAVVVIAHDDKTLTESVRGAVKDALHANLNKDNADVAYAMLFGDKSAMSYRVYNAFSFAGVSHMLAVSGLHVGFLVSFMTFFLSLFRSPDKLNIVIIAVVLVFYCTLCDFTASVVRATVMALVLMLGGLLGEQHDNLSSLSLAGVVILLFNPLDLFDYGYQLSFMCVLAIITLNKYVTTLLVKIKIPHFLASALSISLAVNIAIAPLTAILFGEINIIGIISNLFLVPIFSIAFPLLFYLSLITAAMRFMGFTLFVPNVLLHIVRMTCSLIADNFSKINVLHISYGVVFLMIAFIMLLKYLMVKTKYKTIILSVLVAAMCALTVAGVVPKSYKTSSVILWGQYDTNCTVVTTQIGKTILFDYDEYSTTKYMRRYKIATIDNWINPSLTLSNIDSAIEVIDRYKIKTMYVVNRSEFNNYSLSKILEHCDIKYVGDEQFKGDCFEMQMFSTQNKVYAVALKTTKTMLFDMGMTSEQMETVGESLSSNINYCITKSSKYDTTCDLSNIRDVVCTKDAVDKNIKSIADSSSFVLQL